MITELQPCVLSLLLLLLLLPFNEDTQTEMNNHEFTNAKLHVFSTATFYCLGDA